MSTNGIGLTVENGFFDITNKHSLPRGAMSVAGQLYDIGSKHPENIVSTLADPVGLHNENGAENRRMRKYARSKAERKRKIGRAHV